MTVTAPSPGQLGTGPDDPAPPHVIATTGLSKRFRGGQLAVDSLELRVPAGSVYGFLGPNGSGKTTTVRLLLGLATPTAGAVELFGEPMPRAGRAVLARVGALVEGPAFYPYLSGPDNLARFDATDATADPRTRPARIAAALERVGLSAVRRKHVKAYSLGMKQRLSLAVALLKPRDLLVLDEPTNGLDPQGTREVRALVRDLAADGTTVFFSSHLLAEVEQICTHAAVMNHGRLVADGQVEEIRRAVRGRLVVRTPDAARAAKVLGRLGLADLRVGSDGVDGEAGDRPPEELCAALVGEGVRIRSFTTEHASLEDAFVALTGEGFDVDG